MGKLEVLRDRIGDLDREILARAAERVALARAAGELKRQRTTATGLWRSRPSRQPRTLTSSGRVLSVSGTASSMSM